MSIRMLLAAVVLPLVLCSCAAYRNYSRQEDCENSINDYSKMVRWVELGKAATVLVDRQQREAYLHTADSLRQRSVTMVDYRILSQACHPERGTAESVMEFDYFVLPDSRLKTVTDHQKWVYREEQSDDQVPGWKLTTPPPVFN